MASETSFSRSRSACSRASSAQREREIFIDNLLVRGHLFIEMILVRTGRLFQRKVVGLRPAAVVGRSGCAIFFTESSRYGAIQATGAIPQVARGSKQTPEVLGRSWGPTVGRVSLLATKG